MSKNEEEKRKLTDIVLAEFSNDLWIERRFKLDEIINRLEDLSNEKNQVSQKDLITDWLVFIRFLRDYCSGLDLNNLDKKQWGELLNLMQINRRLNHLSVKFKDIIANKHQIESNALSIKEFNRRVKLSQVIEANLTELDRLVRKSSNLNLAGSLESGYSIRELQETKNNLIERCDPLLSSLRLAINDRTLIRDHRFESWKLRESDTTLMYDKLLELVELLIDLESKLIRISSLMTDDLSNDIGSKTDGQNKSQVRKSIEYQRLELMRIQRYHRDTLLSLLHDISIKSRRLNESTTSHIDPSIQLIKLFEPKKLISLDDIRFKIKELDECQMKLDEIMLSLRREFGRFYFINDTELLTIVMIDNKLVMNETSKYEHIICKLYNNSISAFIIEKQSLIGIKSPSGETILFRNEEPIALDKKNIQVYSLEIIRILNEVQRKLRRTLKFLLLDSLGKEPTIMDWSLPIQLMNLCEYVRFCRRIESILSAKDTFDSLIEEYEYKSSEIRKKLKENPTTKLESLKLSAAISMNVHFLSLLIYLKHEDDRSVNVWAWKKQVRYYVDKNEDLLVKIANSVFIYKFDYLPVPRDNSFQDDGDFKRLIQTKITERCFLLASQAVCHLRLGANPYGPAGSGKTETIKALAHLLGCQIIVHNCDQSNDSLSLERLIWGLVHTGLWGCFDEFNRLGSSTLSAISSTLELVQTNIRAGKVTVQLADGNMVCIDKDSAFFITLNPAGASVNSRYKGRRHLPANLRSLFLPVSMGFVQIDSIVKESLLTLLTADNIEDSIHGHLEIDIVGLGRKISQILEEMKIKKIALDRCEWDLRLVVATLQRLKVLARSTGKKLETELESMLIRSLFIEVEPRLGDEEMTAFKQCLHEHSGFDLMEAKKGSSRSLEKLAEFLKDQLETRVGVLLLGPPRSGKSTVWRSLLTSLRSDKTSCLNYKCINPRSCDPKYLFGYIDRESPNRKWHDGILTSKIRESLDELRKSPNINRIFIILDGPIDPDWIESLNSVLDDNQVLTLSSGERLNFSLPTGQSIKLIFETDSIELASPATVSRLGLIYFDGNQNEQDNRHRSSLARNITVSNHTELSKNEELIAKCSHSLKFDEPSSCNNSLMIIIGPRLDHSAVKDFCRLLDDKSPVRLISYSCNEYSTSKDLLDLFSKGYRGACLYIFNNIHLIEADDGRWKSKSFLEFLRFVIDYNGFYDYYTNSFIPLERSRFILTMNKQLVDNPRLISKAGLILTLEEEDIEQTIETISLDSLIKYLEDPNCDPILILRLVDYHGDNKRIQQILSTGNDNKLGLFSNSSMTLESFKEISKDLKNDGFNYANSRFYILNGFELKLFSDQMRGKLFHLLNKINNHQAKHYQPVKLICLLDGDDEYHYTELLSSFGRVYNISGDDPSKGYKKKTEIMSDSIIKSCKLSDSSSYDEIKDLIEKTIHELIGFKESFKCDTFIESISLLYQESSSNLMIKKRALTNGMNYLAEFEIRLKSMKDNLIEQEKVLESKNDFIDKTTLSMNEILQSIRDEKIKVDKLKDELEEKKRKVLKKSQQIENELTKVTPLIESSRLDICRHLKPEAINEIRTLRSPSKIIKDILDVLFLLLGFNQEDLTWSKMRSYLAKSSLLRDELTNFNFESRLNNNLLIKVDRLINERTETSFNEDQAKRASKAIVPIMKWCLASVQYGRVLIGSEPLRIELAKLKNELEEHNSNLRESESKLKELNDKIRSDTEILNEIRRNKEDLERKSKEIESQYSRLRKLNSDLQGQYERWKIDLGDIVKILHSNRLMKLCMLLISLAFYYEKGLEHFKRDNDKADPAREDNLRVWWLKRFNLEAEFSQSNLFNMIFDLMFNGISSSRISSDEEERFIREIALSLSIEFTRRLKRVNLTYVITDTIDEMTQDQLMNTLCSKQIVCLSSSSMEMSYIRYNQQTGGNQLVDFTSRLHGGSLIILDIREQQQVDNRTQSSHQLDLAYLLLEQMPLGSRIIIVGESTSLLAQALAARLNLFDLRKQSINDNDIQAVIMDKFINFYKPDLMKSLKKLRNQLENKQKEMKSNELNLLNQLVDSTATKEADNNNWTAIKILDQLNKLNISLTDETKILDSKQKEMNQVQNDRLLIDCSLDAAKFYIHFIQSSDRRCFSYLTITKYVDLLLTGNEMCTIKPNYKLIVDYIRHSMNHQARLKFENELNHYDHSVTDGLSESKPSSKLREALLELILEDKNFDRKWRLAVVLHEQNKSSPLKEIDSLFQGTIEPFRKQQRVEVCKYHKIYATSDEVQLKLALQRFFESPGSGEQGSKNVQCLTIVSSHLAANWIDYHMVACLESICHSNQNDTDGDAINLIILVAESAATSIDEYDTSVATPFEQSGILDHADLRYLHDEMSSSLIERFDMFSRNLIIEDDSREDEIISLSNQLVLFHVVCQERSKFNMTRTNQYNSCYDYDQLCLAFKVMDQISRENTGIVSLRSELCNYLGDIVYGSRMETEENERELKVLIELFLGSDESGKEQLNKLELLRSSSKERGFERGSDNYSRILEDLIRV